MTLIAPKAATSASADALATLVLAQSFPGLATVALLFKGVMQAAQRALLEPGWRGQPRGGPVDSPGQPKLSIWRRLNPQQPQATPDMVTPGTVGLT